MATRTHGVRSRRPPAARPDRCSEPRSRSHRRGLHCLQGGSARKGRRVTQPPDPVRAPGTVARCSQRRRAARQLAGLEEAHRLLANTVPARGWLRRQCSTPSSLECPDVPSQPWLPSCCRAVPRPAGLCGLERPALVSARLCRSRGAACSGDRLADDRYGSRPLSPSRRPLPAVGCLQPHRRLHRGSEGCRPTTHNGTSWTVHGALQFREQATTACEGLTHRPRSRPSIPAAPRTDPWALGWQQSLVVRAPVAPACEVSMTCACP